MGGNCLRSARLPAGRTLTFLSPPFRPPFAYSRLVPSVQMSF